MIIIHTENKYISYKKLNNKYPQQNEDSKNR